MHWRDWPVHTQLRLWKALSDETRLRILKLLEAGELCVCHIVAVLGMGLSLLSVATFLPALLLWRDSRRASQEASPS